MPRSGKSLGVGDGAVFRVVAPAADGSQYSGGYAKRCTGPGAHGPGPVRSGR